MVGFQTEADRRGFISYLVSEGRAEILDDHLVRAFGRVVRVEAFPDQHRNLRDRASGDHCRAIAAGDTPARSLIERDMIIGVDRLDYSKGLPQRLDAFQTLLETYAENRGRVTFMQIAPPTRAAVKEYIEIRQELETKAGHINGRFAEFDWVPIRYLNKSFSRRSLLGFYRISRIGLVTPLRDGMNLVAKEYVAAQDPEDPGVLVLSRFAGAAAELSAALIVNPYDIESVAESLQRGLTMPLEERRGTPPNHVGRATAQTTSAAGETASSRRCRRHLTDRPTLPQPNDAPDVTDMDRSPPALIADLGATNARFALVDANGIDAPMVLRCATYPDLFTAASAYLEQVAPPVRAGPGSNRDRLSDLRRLCRDDQPCMVLLDCRSDRETGTEPG